MRVPASFATFGAGVGVALLACGLVPLEASAQTKEPAERAPCTCPGPSNPSKPPGVSAKPKFADASATAFLDENDEIAALEAIRVALTEVGDGGSYVWRRTHGRLSGVVQPTASFKDPAGRVCRHIVLTMSIGMATAKAEGIACRLADGRWQLDG
jgi:surface antigen